MTTIEIFPTQPNVPHQAATIEETGAEIYCGSDDRISQICTFMCGET